MSHDLPPSTAEGALVRRARERVRPKISIATAAKQANMSPENWGHVERGYQSMGRNQPARTVIPPAGTLAHMANAVGITPQELESIGRSDAAEALADLHSLHTSSPQLPSPHGQPSNLARELVARLRATAEAEGKTLSQVLEEGGAHPEELAGIEVHRLLRLEGGEIDPEAQADRLAEIFRASMKNLVESTRRAHNEPNREAS